MRISPINISINTSFKKKPQEKIASTNEQREPLGYIPYLNGTNVEKVSILLQKKAELKTQGTQLQKEATIVQSKAKELGEKYQALGNKFKEEITEKLNNTGSMKKNSIGFKYFNEYEDGKKTRQIEYQIIDGEVTLRNITEYREDGKLNGINYNLENELSYLTIGYAFPAPDAYKEEQYIKYTKGIPVQVKLASESDSLGSSSFTKQELLYNETGVYQINQNIRAEVPFYQSIDYRYNYENGNLKTIDERLDTDEIINSEGKIETRFEPLRTYKY